MGVGNLEAALSYLERAAGEHEIGIAGLKVNPVYDALRSQPRFQALLARLGFPD